MKEDPRLQWTMDLAYTFKKLPSEILAMPPEEWSLCLAWLFKNDPEYRQDARIGKLCMFLTGGATTVADFMPHPVEPVVELNPDRAEAEFMAFALNMGGTLIEEEAE